MHNQRCFILCLIFLMASLGQGNVSMNHCSISCGDSNIQGQFLQTRQTSTGPPGKRGPVGPVGPPDPRGPQGEIGQLGTSCNCQKFEEELQVMKILFSRMREMVMREWSRASNGRWYRYFTDKQTYDQANARCNSYGGKLASAGMRNATVKREIISVLGIGTNANVWIGLNDKRIEGVWMWEDGVPSTVENTDWFIGQPDDHQGGEDCGHLRASYSYNDHQCSQQFLSVCETDEM